MSWTDSIAGMVAAALAVAIVALNGFFFVVEQMFFSGKAQVDPSKSVIVITGCDSGFGEMTSRRLSAMGFKVVSACLTEEGCKNLKDTVRTCHSVNRSDPNR